MDKEYFHLKRYSYIRTIVLLALISLPFIATDCANSLLNGTNTGDVKGSWQLNDIQGNLQDVCLGETAVFPSSTGGTATLTCPNSNPLSRIYTVSNNVLTYTETGVAYDVSSDGTTLTLTGANNLGRKLIYTKIGADSKTGLSGKQNSSHHNSSDK